MSVEELQIMYEAVDTDATFEEFVFLVADETDVKTILSWFKGFTIH